MTISSPNTRVYIGNLDYATTLAELRELLGAHGRLLDCTIFVDPVTLTSRGYAFARYADAADAERAILAVNRQTLRGRQLRVQPAKPRGAA